MVDPVKIFLTSSLITMQNLVIVLILVITVVFTGKKTTNLPVKNPLYIYRLLPVNVEAFYSVNALSLINNKLKGA